MAQWFRSAPRGVKRTVKWGWLGLLGAIAILLLGQLHSPHFATPAIAQTPAAPSAVTPNPGASPAAPPSLTLPSGTQPSPAQTASPTATPAPAPSPQPVPAFVPPPAQFPPAATAPALPIASQPYSDPAGRFQVGIRQGYQTSPLAGTILVESPNGNLAYTVVAQSQPSDAPIALSPSFANIEALGKIATTVFQRGEGFQTGPPQPEAGGGIIMNWSGSLTIGGKTQPTGGVILVRPTTKYILLAIVAATEAGADQVQGTVAAIADSLKGT
jgi:hypothetical protein